MRFSYTNKFRILQPVEPSRATNPTWVSIEAPSRSLLYYAESGVMHRSGNIFHNTLVPYDNDKKVSYF